MGVATPVSAGTIINGYYSCGALRHANTIYGEGDHKHYIDYKYAHFVEGGFANKKSVWPTNPNFDIVSPNGHHQLFNTEGPTGTGSVYCRNLSSMVAGGSYQSIAETDSSVPVPRIGVPNYSSPLQRALFGDPKEWVLKQNQEKAAIADCMHERGFEGYRADSSLIVLPETIEQSYEEGVRFGYGISTQFEADRAEDSANGVNAAFFAGLSIAERQAVDRAMWAGKDSLEPGCMYQGHLTAFGNLLFLTDEYDKLNTDINAAMQVDRDLLNANADWSRCMLDSGYRFSEPSAAITSIADEFSAIESYLGRPAERSDREIITLKEREMAVYRADQICDAAIDRTVRYLAARDRIEQEQLAAYPTFGRMTHPPAAETKNSKF